MKPRERQQQTMRMKRKKRLREVGEVPRKRRPSKLQQLSSNLKVRVVRRRRRIAAHKKKKRRLKSPNLPP